MVKLVKSRFLGQNYLIFQILSKKKNWTVTWTISNNFCFVLFSLDYFFVCFIVDADAKYAYENVCS